MSNESLTKSLSKLGLRDLVRQVAQIEKFAQAKSSFETEKQILTTIRDIVKKCQQSSLEDPILEEISLPPFLIETAQKTIMYKGEPLTGFSKKDIIGHAIPNFLNTFTSKYMRNREPFLAGSKLAAYQDLKAVLDYVVSLTSLKYNKLLHLKPSKDDLSFIRKTTKIRKEDIQTGIRHLETLANEVSLFNSYLINTYLPRLDFWTQEAKESATDENELEEHAEAFSRLAEVLRQPPSDFEALKREVQQDVIAQLDVSPEDFKIISEILGTYVVNPFIKFRRESEFDVQSFLKKYADEDKDQELDDLISKGLDEELEDSSRGEDSPEQSESSKQQETPTPQQEEAKQDKSKNLADKLLGRYQFMASSFQTTNKEITTLLRRIKTHRTSIFDKENKPYSPQLLIAAQAYLVNEWKARYAALLVMACIALKRNKYSHEGEKETITPFSVAQNTQSEVIEEDLVRILNKAINIL